MDSTLSTNFQYGSYISCTQLHAQNNMQFGGQSNVIAMYRSFNIAQFFIKVAIFNESIASCDLKPGTLSFC